MFCSSLKSTRLTLVAVTTMTIRPFSGCWGLFPLCETLIFSALEIACHGECVKISNKKKVVLYLCLSCGLCVASIVRWRRVIGSIPYQEQIFKLSQRGNYSRENNNSQCYFSSRLTHPRLRNETICFQNKSLYYIYLRLLLDFIPLSFHCQLIVWCQNHIGKKKKKKAPFNFF